MATQRAITSSRGGSSMAMPDLHNDHLLQMEKPMNKKKYKQGKKNQQHNKSMPLPAVAAVDGVVSDAESVEEEDDNSDDSDEPDDHTRSMPRQKSMERRQTEEQEIWEGIGEGIEFDLEDPEGDDASDAEIDEADEAGEEADEADLEKAVDDDDYGDLDDNMDDVSVASADSRQFEAEVEQELQQLAEEDGIDWDDDQTYQYNRSWPAGTYALDVDLTTPDSVFDLEVFRPADEEYLFVAEELADNTIAPNDQNNDIARSQITFGEEWPMPSDSENEDAMSEKTDVGVERRLSRITEGSEISAMTETGYETDEEDMREAVIDSPATKLFKTPQRPGKSTLDRRITASTPRRSGLKPTVMKNLAFRHKKKAVAYTVREPYGNVIHFKTPKGSKLHWIQVRARRESESSDNDPPSPTMVDLDNALLEGNTRTGAHISDAINGRLFQQYHCTQLQLPEPSDFAESSLPEFARNPILRSFVDTVYDHLEDFYVNQDDVQDLIDFEGGFSEDPTPVSRTASFAGFEDGDDSQTVVGHQEQAKLDDELEWQGVSPTTSPLKRRASGLPTMDSPMKRNKVEV